MSQASFKSTPSGAQPSSMLERIDLDAHPDRDLLRLCNVLVKMRGQLEALERAVDAMAVVTPEGRRFKELTL